MHLGRNFRLRFGFCLSVYLIVSLFGKSLSLPHHSESDDIDTDSDSENTRSRRNLISIVHEVPGQQVVMVMPKQAEDGYWRPVVRQRTAEAATVEEANKEQEADEYSAPSKRKKNRKDRSMVRQWKSNTEEQEADYSSVPMRQQNRKVRPIVRQMTQTSDVEHEGGYSTLRRTKGRQIRNDYDSRNENENSKSQHSHLHLGQETPGEIHYFYAPENSKLGNSKYERERPSVYSKARTQTQTANADDNKVEETDSDEFSDEYDSDEFADDSRSEEERNEATDHEYKRPRQHQQQRYPFNKHSWLRQRNPSQLFRMQSRPKSKPQNLFTRIMRFPSLRMENDGKPGQIRRDPAVPKVESSYKLDSYLPRPEKSELVFPIDGMIPYTTLPSEYNPTHQYQTLPSYDDPLNNHSNKYGYGKALGKPLGENQFKQSKSVYKYEDEKPLGMPLGPEEAKPLTHTIYYDY